jgi:hypothetical protein
VYELPGRQKVAATANLLRVNYFMSAMGPRNNAVLSLQKYPLSLSELKQDTNCFTPRESKCLNQP